MRSRVQSHLFFEALQSSLSFVLLRNSVGDGRSLARTGWPGSGRRCHGSGFSGFLFNALRLEDPELGFLDEETESVQVVLDLLVRLDVAVADQQLHLE